MATSSRLFQWYATLGPIGYLPASGTFATLVTLIPLYLVKNSVPVWLYGIGLYILYWCAHIFITKILNRYTDEDPSQIVLDEVVGCLVTFYAVPISGITLLLGFLLFRFFDITKLGPVGRCEKIKGAHGILLDDVVAGIISNGILQVIVQLCMHS